MLATGFTRCQNATAMSYPPSIVVKRDRARKKVVCIEKEDISHLLLYPSLGLGLWNNDSSTLSVIDSFIALKYSRREVSVKSVQYASKVLKIVRPSTIDIYKVFLN